MSLALRTFSIVTLSFAALAANAQKYARTVWEQTESGPTDARVMQAVRLPGGDVLWIGDKEGSQVDLWVRRITPSGNVLWSKTYSKPGAAGDLSCQKALLGPAGNIVIACDATGNATVYDTYFIKIDQDGVKLAENTFDRFDWDLISGFDIGPNGNVVYTCAQIDPWQYTVTKLDPDLNELWTTSLGNVGQDDQYPSAPTITANGDVLVPGVVSDGVQTNARLNRLDASGSIVYTKTFGSAATNEGGVSAYQSTTNNTYLCYVADQFQPGVHVVLVQLDAAGSVQWSLSDSDIAAGIVRQFPSGDLVVAGPTFPSPGVSSQKFARITEAGTVVWTNNLPSPDIEHNFTRRLEVAPDGLVYSTAHATKTGGSGTVWEVECLTEDGVIVYQWLLPADDATYNFPNAIVPLEGGAALVGGEIGDAADDDAHIRRLQAEFNVFPLNTTIRLGRLNSGNLASLIDDDDSFYEVCKFIVPNLTTPPVNVEFDSFVPAGYPMASLAFKVVSKSNTPGLSQNVELWNWTTGSWDRSTVGPLLTTEKTVNVVASTTDHVQAGTRLVKARVRVSVSGPVTTNAWCVKFDQATWTAKP